jgi:hypothetical protein
VGAWYHILAVLDTTETVAADRAKLYVNGSQITAFDTANYPAEDFEPEWNDTVVHDIGRRSASDNQYYDGYLAEVYNIDGQALTPSDFGETDTTTNQWKPIDASDLTFGTNGFYQKYAATELADSFTDSGWRWRCWRSSPSYEQIRFSRHILYRNCRHRWCRWYLY